MNSPLRPDPERGRSPIRQPVQNRLTNALLACAPNEFEAATQHHYLRAAGEGKLTKRDLSRWLSQDRLYAESYISFICSLIARVTLPYNFVSDKSTSLRWRILHLLTGALENIHRELEFFTSTAQNYDLQLDLAYADDVFVFGPNRVTESYMTLFQSFQLEPTQSLLDGLIVLWATEKCYLDAWTYASTFLSKDGEPSQDADAGALRREFIPNWTSPEFHKFVQDIADVTDEWAAREGALKKIEVSKALWLHVLEIEKGFWPDVHGS